MNQSSDQQNYGQDEFLDYDIGNFRDEPTSESSDHRIEEEVYKVLIKDKYIDTSQIDVKVLDGVVILSGTVDSRSDKIIPEIAIEEIARGAGIKDILNEIKIKRWGDYSVRTYQKVSEDNLLY